MHSEMAPDGWNVLAFYECVDGDSFPHKASIQQRNYRAAGRFPIVDQGTELVAGYCDDQDEVYDEPLPLILFGDHTRTFKFLDFPFATGADGTKLLKPNAEVVDPLFLYYAFRALDIPSQGYNRHFRALREQVVLVPTEREEQKRIASLFATLERTVKTERTIATKLSDLKMATMSKFFREGLRCAPLKETEIGSIPEDWEVLPLGSIAKVGNGSTPSRSNESYWNPGVFPWITSTKVHEVFIREGSELVSETALRECHLPVVPSGSLVIAITGQGKTLGNVALLEIETCVNQHLAYVRFQDDRAVPEFLLFWLQNLYDFFRQISSGGGSTKGALTCGFLSRLSVPLPKRDEQQEIARVLVDITKRHQLAVESALSTSALFDAALHEIMTGSISIKDLDLPEVTHV